MRDLAPLQFAILNIASNARDAMNSGGRLTIATRQSSDENGSAAELSLTDTGPGMDVETQARVFEPFFTAKAAGRGTGLGLSQVYGFATQSGGRVGLASKPGEGTTFTLTLPCSANGESAAIATMPPTEKLAAARILVVDDNEQVGALAEALLADQGHDVGRANSAEAALNLIADSSNTGKQFDRVKSPARFRS